MYNIIIFSKNRPAQLDLLLRSVVRFVPHFFGENLVIITKATTEEYKKGYLHLPAATCLVDEKDDFKKQVIENVRPGNALTVFFTDDDVFINEWPGLSKNIEWKDLLTVSLCLWPGITKSYTNNKDLIAPKFSHTDLGVYWNWQGADTEWDYPMRVTGNIFQTSDLLPVLEKTDFSNPNLLEANMAMGPIQKSRMFCYHRPYCTNIAANRVQDTFRNRSMDQRPEDLNERFLSGERIDLEPLIGKTFTAPHNEFEYRWRY